MTRSLFSVMSVLKRISNLMTNYSQFEVNREDEAARSQNENHGTVEPPDGGWGWFVVFAASIYTMVIFGFHNSFGVYLLAFLETFNQSTSLTALVGSLSYGLIMCFGPLSAKLMERFGARELSICGSVIVMISVIASSFVTSLDALFLTHGFLMGIGSSFSVTPGMIMISRYFTTQRSFATGIVLAGGSLGTLLQTQLHRYLIEVLGWRISLRVYSVTVLACIIAAFAYRPHAGTPPSVIQNFKTSPLKGFIVDLGLWKDRVFEIWVCANSLVKFGFFIPYVHMIKLAFELDISVTDSSNIMIVLAIASLFSRLVFGKICDSDSINRLYVNQASMFFVGFLYLLIPACKNYATLVFFAFFLGLADAGNYVLLPVLTFDLMGAERMPIAWGFMMAVNSISCFGPPFAGWIHDITGSYSVGFAIPGVFSIGAACILAFVPSLKRSAFQSGRSIIQIPYCEETQELVPWESLNAAYEGGDGENACPTTMENPGANEVCVTNITTDSEH